MLALLESQDDSEEGKIRRAFRKASFGEIVENNIVENI